MNRLVHKLRHLPQYGPLAARVAGSALAHLPVLLWGRPVDQLIIVSGASENHARSLMQFAKSAVQHEPTARLILFDLGLTPATRERLAREIPRAEIRAFDFSRYPAWMDIRVNAGEYAWKPTIIGQVLDDAGHTPVLWMDAGNKIVKPLGAIRRLLQADGFYSPHSSGTVRDWTHPGTLNYLGAGAAYGHLPNLNGCCIGFHPAHPQARALITRWRELSLVKDCLAPAGSSRQNHRQDQALLTVLAYQNGLGFRGCRMLLGFQRHQDVDSAPTS